MSVRVLVDRQNGNACLWDSVTSRAFGPVFDYFEHDPDDFLSWLGREDAREANRIPVEQLEALYGRWIDEAQCCAGVKEGDGHDPDCDNYGVEDDACPSGARAE